MFGYTELEYAMKFRMLIVMDEKNTSQMDQYAENFKNIIESYSRMLIHHPRLALPEENGMQPEEVRANTKTLEEICTGGNIGLVLRQNCFSQNLLFTLLVEAIYRTIILVHYYAPEGELLAAILKETYCGKKERTDIQLCRTLYVSRTTFYRRKQQAILFAGYLFYEAVLPEMEGKI